MRDTVKLILCLLCLISPLCYAGNVKLIYVHRADASFEVTLPTNPTTGYQWQITHFDENILALTSKEYTSMKKKARLVGAGGLTRFIFRLKKGKVYPADTMLQFKYLRIWDPKRANMTTVKVVFQPRKSS
jgi:inhibitor of cysteine peptidase